MLGATAAIRAFGVDKRVTCRKIARSQIPVETRAMALARTAVALQRAERTGSKMATPAVAVARAAVMAKIMVAKGPAVVGSELTAERRADGEMIAYT